MAVYVEQPQCVGAERELAQAGDRAGEIRVRVICLPSAERGGRLDLATLGTNARRATEDSASVAYLATPKPAATRFTAPILEAASVPQLTNADGAAAMSTLLRAIKSADTSSSLRESVNDDLS